MIDNKIRRLTPLSGLFCGILCSLLLVTVQVNGTTGLKLVAEESGGIRAAQAVLEQFLNFEQKQQYDRCYDLLSSNFKAALKGESGIRDRSDYKQMRKFQGLRWHSPKITEKRLTSNGEAVIFSVETTFEQHIIGERMATDRISVGVTVLMENGSWFIDSWTGS